MINKSINGKEGNNTSIEKDEHFEPTFKTFPLTQLKKGEKDSLEIPDENVKIMRDFDIENKK